LDFYTFCGFYIAGWLILIVLLTITNKDKSYSGNDLRGCFWISGYALIGFVAGFIYMLT